MSKSEIAIKSELPRRMDKNEITKEIKIGSCNFAKYGILKSCFLRENAIGAEYIERIPVLKRLYVCPKH